MAADADADADPTVREAAGQDDVGMYRLSLSADVVSRGVPNLPADSYRPRCPAAADRGADPRRARPSTHRPARAADGTPALPRPAAAEVGRLLVGRACNCTRCTVSPIILLDDHRGPEELRGVRQFHPHRRRRHPIDILDLVLFAVVAELRGCVCAARVHPDPGTRFAPEHSKNTSFTVVAASMGRQVQIVQEVWKQFLETEERIKVREAPHNPRGQAHLRLPHTLELRSLVQGFLRERREQRLYTSAISLLDFLAVKGLITYDGRSRASRIRAPRHHAGRELHPPQLPAEGQPV